MNKYSIFKISKMLPPPPPPNADFDIYGNLTLSQFFDEIKKFTESQVQIVCKINFLNSFYVYHFYNIF